MPRRDIDIEQVIGISVIAGDAVMAERTGTGGIAVKSDRSPVSRADRVSHKLIVDALKVRWPEIPVISEEGTLPEYSERVLWEKYWLVDPLDGTKEFLQGREEFTLNIALIENGEPALGVVYAPSLDRLFYGRKGAGAFRMVGGIVSELRDKKEPDELTAVRSRSHSARGEKDVLVKLGVKRTVVAGSSLKFCSLAEGKAHVYYRHGPLWEWDSAAGHAVLQEAGGTVHNVQYNTREFKNSRILCLSPGLREVMGEEVIKDFQSTP